MTLSTRTSYLAAMGLALVAVALLVAIYFAPIWWVSLKAPNYPPEAFPDGVRIHFHMNGVFNGCKKVERAEILEKEALDCVHEMDTINHYVGMYPIAAGGPVERFFSPFLLSMLGVMVLGFACSRRNLRVGMVLGGFVAIAAWMSVTYFAQDGVRFQPAGYLLAQVTAMDQDAGTGDTAAADTGVSAGAALIARLKAELAKSEEKARETEQASQVSEKQRLINSLRVTFQKDQERKRSGAEWNGSGRQLMLWHYEKNLGRYFNVPEEIRPLVAKMNIAGYAMYFAILAAMVILGIGAWQGRGPLYWLMGLAPLGLPLFFVIDYSGWLYWFGHNLNEMGAFTVKAFMPTVFGDGKVAQFSTHSYPYWGFGLMLAFAAVVGAIVLLRRNQLSRRAAPR
jgi:hypothetical protein